MKKLLTAILIMAVIAITPAISQGANENENGYKTLNVYTALDSEEAKYYIAAFEEETGIDVNEVRMGSGEVAARIEAERNNPGASVWFGGSNTDHISAASKGLLASYKPNTTFTLTEIFHAPDYEWCGFYTGIIGFCTNTDYMKKNNLKAPTSWADLLKPEFNGEIEMAYPYTSGTAYTTLGTLIELYGLDGALEWWKGFDKNIHQYTKSGTACIARAGLGECTVGIAFSHDILTKGIQKGYPLVLTFPSEGSGYEVGGVSLIKGAKESVEAKKFIDWVFTIQAQNLFVKYNRIPVNPKATVAEGAIKLTDINLVDYDAIALGEAKEANVKAWRDAIGK